MNTVGRSLSRHPLHTTLRSRFTWRGFAVVAALSTTPSLFLGGSVGHGTVPHILGSEALVPRSRRHQILSSGRSLDAHGASEQRKMSASAGQSKTSPFVKDEPKAKSIPASRLTLSEDKYRVTLYEFPNSSLNPQLVIDPIEGATHTVLVMHGLGDTCEGWLEPVVKHYLPALHGKVRFILPSAPNSPVTLNMGMEMPSWYDIKSLDADRANQSCDGIEESRQHIEWILQKEIDNGVPAKNIVIGGFSQGGALALYTGLQQQATYAGILVKSGYLPNAENLTVSSEAKDTPIHFFHGRDDQVVKHQWGVATRDKVRDEFGVKSVDFKDYGGLDHGASEEELRDVSAWLKKIVPSE